MESKILIIDDDASFLRILEYTLQQEDYPVFTAESAEDGLTVFREQNPALVITDMKLPGMDGLQVVKAVKERASDTLVIIVTAYGEIELAVEAMKNGAYDYITKPFSRDELKLTVKKALQHRAISDENRRLRKELSGGVEFRDLIGSSPGMEKVIDMVRKVSDTEATVLITGESGTGKEMIARAVHSLSGRKAGPFIPINCAAIPGNLLESELFGHLKGAFTGAVKDRQGKFQQAEGGTLFLDEVGELPIDLQPKLLRALQERIVEPLGGGRPQKLDVRVVAATNLHLEEALEKGCFREDLYYRLSVIPIHLPPLRERREDIPLLLRFFAGKYGCPDLVFAQEALEKLMAYSWPGNVREIENTIERLIIMRRSDRVTPADLSEKIHLNHRKGRKPVYLLPDEGYSLEALERDVVLEALLRNQWNQSAAARFLRIPRHILLYRMEKYEIAPP